jgi:hypothetical protein
MHGLFDRNHKGTSGGTWGGYTSMINNGESPNKSQRGFTPGTGPAFLTFPERRDDPEPFENLAARIGGLWLMISLG